MSLEVKLATGTVIFTLLLSGCGDTGAPTIQRETAAAGAVGTLMALGTPFPSWTSTLEPTNTLTPTLTPTETSTSTVTPTATNTPVNADVVMCRDKTVFYPPGQGPNLDEWKAAIENAGCNKVMVIQDTPVAGSEQSGAPSSWWSWLLGIAGVSAAGVGVGAGLVGRRLRINSEVSRETAKLKFNKENRERKQYGN